MVLRWSYWLLCRPVVNGLSPLFGIASLAEGLEIIGGISSAPGQWNHVVNGQWLFLTTAEATIIIKLTNSFPFILGTRACALNYCAALIVIIYHSLGVFAVCTANSFPDTLSILISPLASSFVYLFALFHGADFGVLAAMGFVFFGPITVIFPGLLQVILTPLPIGFSRLVWVIFSPPPVGFPGILEISGTTFPLLSSAFLNVFMIRGAGLLSALVWIFLMKFPALFQDLISIGFSITLLVLAIIVPLARLTVALVATLGLGAFVKFTYRLIGLTFRTIFCFHFAYHKQRIPPTLARRYCSGNAESQRDSLKVYGYWDKKTNDRPCTTLPEHRHYSTNGLICQLAPLVAV